MSAYVVGITGGIATGKTNVTDALKHAGAQVVDADEISRALTREGGSALPAILAAFGESVFADANPAHLVLDRKKLGALVFSHAGKKAQLESILHPRIIDACRREILASPQAVVFLSAPLLYECGMESMCHEVWCTYIPPCEQLQRLMHRDQSTRQDALARMHSQMPAEEKKNRSDLVIHTGGSREESARQALHAYQRLLQRLK